MSVCRNVILGLETDTSSNISDIVMWPQSLNPVIERPGALLVIQSTWLSADVLLSELIKSMTFCIPRKLNLPVVL